VASNSLFTARFLGRASFCEGVARVNLILSHQELQGPLAMNVGHSDNNRYDYGGRGLMVSSIQDGIDRQRC
jgi:hypothetical protein